METSVDNLSNYFSLKRRYLRSINLERDIDRIDSIHGYFPTNRVIEALERVFNALLQTDINRAFTFSGVYGTGKSSCAHFISALLAPNQHPIHQHAMQIAQSTLYPHPTLFNLISSVSKDGYVRSIVTAEREPLTYTIIKALKNGVDLFWQNSRGKKPIALKQLDSLHQKVLSQEKISEHETLEIAKNIAKAAGTGLLLIIDELGKNLEYAVQEPYETDLYLLQQIAELPSDKNSPCIVLIGILHQSFEEYGNHLTTTQRKEWAKIQGRFEDITFSESTEQMLRLISQVIERTNNKPYTKLIDQFSRQWADTLMKVLGPDICSANLLDSVYPLHPLTAIFLPILSTKYAQNDRSMFTFLTSFEPFSFANYLRSTPAIPHELQPTLKPYALYDYFIESIGTGISYRPQFQRWIEIHSHLTEHYNLSASQVIVLKTIGLLNLIGISGPLRASHSLVLNSLCDHPTDNQEKSHWESIINDLQQKNLIIYRPQADEYRLWQGSDFDFEKAAAHFGEENVGNLDKVLGEYYPLNPFVVQRNSYKTGTLRYFERTYCGDDTFLGRILATDSTSDGIVVYWTSDEPIISAPTYSLDGKPLVIIKPKRLVTLSAASKEFQIISRIYKYSSQLQTDKIARKEVQERLVFAEKALKECLDNTYSSTSSSCTFYFKGVEKKIHSIKHFNEELSYLCDQEYSKGLMLRNELLNRRVLTPQGASARRILIENLITNYHLENLGIKGNGPEISMYSSLLKNSGIHRKESTAWVINPPYIEGIRNVWDSIETFCISALQPTSLDKLFESLNKRPFGVKEGPIPILLTAVLIYHQDDVSIFKDGIYLPTLGSEHFELLVKNPKRFSVKYLSIEGLRASVFRELETALRIPNKPYDKEIRNKSLLGIVSPVIKFAMKLPEYTKKTKRFSQNARNVLDALLNAKDPEILVFEILPKSCGFKPFTVKDPKEEERAKAFRQELVKAIQEIHQAYKLLLSECKDLLRDSFGILQRMDKIREDLRSRASYLIENLTEQRLASFLKAAINEHFTEEEWIENILSIISDKHPNTWDDKDVILFKAKITELARRFKELEDLYTEIRSSKKFDVEAFRISITQKDGHAISKVLWLDKENENTIDDYVNQLMADKRLQDNEIILWGLLTKISKILTQK